MGFAENGKLTDKGKAELKANEYIYFITENLMLIWLLLCRSFAAP